MKTSKRHIREQRHSNRHIHLLGGFHFADDTGSVVNISRARIRLILAYLILHCRSAQSRPRLAYLLWPDSSEKQACTNLRNALFLLGQTLPDAKKCVHITAPTVQWCGNTTYIVDVIEFEAAITQADLAEARDDPSAMQRWLEQAVDLYPGELLPEFYDDWILVERERLSQLFARSLAWLVRVYEERRDYDKAIANAERLLRHAPLRETTHRLLMRLHALAGDRAGALCVYQTCAARLMRELNVAPVAETTALYQRLLATEQLAVAGFPVKTQPRSSANGRVQDRLIGRGDDWLAPLNVWHEIQ